ncbi:hypothetical protein HI914_00394 [Erysiphe necator]|nr:hypothetical protein HI914_00394 [Erysiphe necator]
MRSPSVIKIFLSSVFIFRFAFSLHVPALTNSQLSPNQITAFAANLDTDDTTMDHIMIDNDRSTIKKRSDNKIPLLDRGAMCGKTFYPKKMIKAVAKEACTKLHKLQSSNIWKYRLKITCAPNLPYCYYNYPYQYDGPEEIFNYQKPLYVWPIVASRFKKIIGLKGSDRIVIDLQQKCRLHGLARKSWRGKWTRCAARWI